MELSNSSENYEDRKEKFAIEEYNMLGEERRHLEETQIKYISMTLAAVIAIFTFGTTILTANNQLFVFFIFIIPICLVIPTWLLFIGKAQRITYLQAYSQLLESFLLGHITFTQLGFDNTLKGILYDTYQKIHLNNDFFPTVFKNINSFRKDKKLDEKSPEFLMGLFGHGLSVEVELKRLLNYKTWTDLTWIEKWRFIRYIISFERIGSYWGLIYKIFIFLICVSLFSGFLSLFFINTVKLASNSSSNGYEITSEPNDLIKTIMKDFGTNIDQFFNYSWLIKFIVFLIFFIIILYLVRKITIQHYELNNGILSYQANYDMWCVVLDVKRKDNGEKIGTEKKS